MTAMEIQQWKQNFIEEYLDEIDDLEVMKKLCKYAKRIMPKKENPRPCVVHSQEEMIAAVLKSTEEIERGEYVTDEELSEEIQTWWK